MTEGDDKVALLAGLLLPGGGQWRRREWSSGLLVLVAVAFFWACSVLELVVRNMAAFPAPLRLLREFSTLHSPVRVVPHVVVAALFALTMQIGAAVLACRGPRTGEG